MMRRLHLKMDGVLVYSDYKRLKYRMVYLVMAGALVAVATLMLFPAAWLFLSSFKGPVELYRTPFTLLPEELRLSKIAEVWRMLAFGRYVLNSFWVVAGSIVCAVLFNGLLAYGVSVIRPWGHQVVTALVIGSLMIPPILNMGPLFQSIVGLGLIDSYLPLWLVFGANPFYFLIFKSYFDTLPRALFEAAQLDGCTNMQMFLRIVLPLSMPITSVVAIFAANASWSDFLLPFLVLRSDSAKTVMVKIYSLQSALGTLQGFGPDKMLMLLLLAIIPPTLMFLLFQRQITHSVALTGLKDF